jgi:hypothetical protein
MDGMNLLDRAHEAGLTVVADGDHLKVTGPRRAAPIVAELAAHKAEVLAALTGWPDAVDDWVARWAAEGARTGHEWLACDACGERQLLRPEKAGRACHVTHGCKGRLRRAQGDEPDLMDDPG